MEDQNIFWAVAASAPAISCLLTGFSGQLSSPPHPCSALCITAAARYGVLMTQPEYAEKIGGSYLAQAYQETFQSCFKIIAWAPCLFLNSTESTGSYQYQVKVANTRFGAGGSLETAEFEERRVPIRV